MARTGGRRERHLTERRLLVLASAVAGGVLAASPTGVPAFDALWCAGFAAVLAYWGGFTQRLVLLPVAGAAVVLADTRLSLGLALGAVVVAAANALRPRFSNRWGAGAGGLLGCALLTGNGPSERALAVVTTTALVLVVAVAAHLQMSWRRRRQNWWGLGLLGAVVVVFGGAGGLAALQARGSIDDGIDAFRSAQDVGVTGDLQSAVEAFSDAEAAFLDASGPLSSFGRFGRIIPGLSQQLDAATTAVDVAGSAAEAGRRAGASIDLDDVAISDGGIDLAALADTEPAIDQLSATLASSVSRLLGVDRTLLVGTVSDALDDALEEAVHASTTADRLHRAVQVAPQLLGSDGPRRYLVLFTTPNEARGRIGFPGGYATIRLEGGRFAFESAGSMDRLDNPRAADPATLQIPSRAVPYAKYRSTEAWRSVTLIPDAPTATQLVQQFAERAPEIGPVDGVLYVDPVGLAALVGLLGEVEVPGIGTITEDTTVDFITRRQYIEFPELGEQGDRKDLLGVVAGLVGLRLQGLSVPSVSALTDRFGPAVEAGHLMLTVDAGTAPDAAQLLSDTGADGSFPRVQDAANDIVYVAARDAGGSKIDLFLERTVDYRVRVAEDGTVGAELEIGLTNTAPSSGLPFYLIGSITRPQPPLGTNVLSTLVYSRFGDGVMELDGQPILPLVDYEGGLFVYQVQTDLAPGQTRTLKLTFTGTARGDHQRVTFVPGGLIRPDEATLQVEDARHGVNLTETFTVERPECRAARRESSGCYLAL